MTVTQIIKSIDGMLDLGITESLAEPADMENDVRCKKLLSCCNSVLYQLYGKYKLDPCHAVVQVSGGIVDIDPSAYSVKCIEDNSGNKLRFDYTSQGVAVSAPDGRYNAVFYKVPKSLTFDAEFTLPDPRFTFKLFTYGVIAEYLRRAGDYAAADSWRRQYEDTLATAVELSRAPKLRARRWL